MFAYITAAMYRKDVYRKHLTMGERRFVFFMLPAELRVIIYRFAMTEVIELVPFYNDILRYNRVTLPLSLLLTCRQIHSEARYELQKHFKVPITLVFDMVNALYGPPRNLPAWRIIGTMLQSLEIQIASDQHPSVGDPNPPVTVHTSFLDPRILILYDSLFPLGDRLVGVTQTRAFERFLVQTVLRARQHHTIHLKFKASNLVLSDLRFLEKIVSNLGPQMNFLVTVLVPEGYPARMWSYAMDPNSAYSGLPVRYSSWDYRTRVQLAVVQESMGEPFIWERPTWVRQLTVAVAAVAAAVVPIARRAGLVFLTMQIFGLFVLVFQGWS